jgi:hypothetical protein
MCIRTPDSGFGLKQDAVGLGSITNCVYFSKYFVAQGKTLNTVQYAVVSLSSTQHVQNQHKQAIKHTRSRGFTPLHARTATETKASYCVWFIFLELPFAQKPNTHQPTNEINYTKRQNKTEEASHTHTHKHTHHDFNTNCIDSKLRTPALWRTATNDNRRRNRKNNDNGVASVIRRPASTQYTGGLK